MYVFCAQSMKAYPRDLVLSRGALMPLSLVLATTDNDSRPMVALYVTYDTSLPRPLLQLVVQELQQLLQVSGKGRGPVDDCRTCTGPRCFGLRRKHLCWTDLGFGSLLLRHPCRSAATGHPARHQSEAHRRCATRV
jgi:hypothetical protein